VQLPLQDLHLLIQFGVALPIEFFRVIVVTLVICCVRSSRRMVVVAVIVVSVAGVGRAAAEKVGIVRHESRAFSTTTGRLL